MDHFKRKDRRGAVHVQSNDLGPTVRHGTLPAVSMPPVTAFSPMPMPTPKTTASFDVLSFGFETHPMQLMQSEFTGDYYRSASPLKLDLDSYLNYAEGPDNREMSTISSISADTFSSTGSMFSSSSTDTGDTLTVRNGRGRSRGPSPWSRSGRTKSIDNPTPSFVCLGPQCQLAFSSDKELKSHVKSSHTHICNWAGCDQPSFSTRDGLIHHVKVQHLVICPSPGCTETSFQSIRILQSHISMAHPEDGKDDAKEWELPMKAADNTKKDDRSPSSKTPIGTITSRKRKSCDPEAEMALGLSQSKRHCLDRLRSVVEKRARKSAGECLKYLLSGMLLRRTLFKSSARVNGGKLTVQRYATKCREPYRPCSGTSITAYRDNEFPASLRTCHTPFLVTVPTSLGRTPPRCDCHSR
jgi:hypothetical protein